jgi:hypothetical protein
LLAKETEIKIHRILILPVLLYGCAASSHIEKRTQRVFKNRVLRKIFRPKRVQQKGSGKDYITRGFMMCTARQIFRKSYQE